MQTPQGKTKNAMLLELESIKGLLVEEDIPVLEEVVIQDIPLLETIVPPEDLPEDAIPLLNLVVPEETLGEPPLLSDPIPDASEAAEEPAALNTATIIPQAAEAVQTIGIAEIAKAVAAITTGDGQPIQPRRHREEQQQDFFQLLPEPEPEPSSEPRSTARSIGDNPFLPQHIRARLQGSNAPFGSNVEDTAQDSPSKRFQNLSQGIYTAVPNAKKTSPIQQQLINEIMDKMLPEMAKELRGRLEKLNRQTLEELLAEHK